MKEFVVAPATRGNGSTWNADLSPDRIQTYLYTADGENNHVWTLPRESGRILSRQVADALPFARAVRTRQGRTRGPRCRAVRRAIVECVLRPAQHVLRSPKGGLRNVEWAGRYVVVPRELDNAAAAAGRRPRRQMLGLFAAS